MSKTAARLFAPLAAFTNSANAYFRKSSSDRAKAQQEAKGTAKGPSGAEVDAAVAATMTKAQKEEWAKKQAEKEKEETKAEGKENGMPAAPAAAPAEAEAEAEKKVEKVEAEPVAAPVAVPAEAVVAPAAAAAATPTAIESAPAEAPKVEAEAAPAAGTTAATTGTYKLPSGATVVIPDAGTLPRDERGRRVGLEDLDDPALKEDPAILAATTAQALDGTTVDTQGKAYVDPRIYGGTSFDLVGNGEHEPLNVISEFSVSGLFVFSSVFLFGLGWKRELGFGLAGQEISAHFHNSQKAPGILAWMKGPCKHVLFVHETNADLSFLHSSNPINQTSLRPLLRPDPHKERFPKLPAQSRFRSRMPRSACGREAKGLGRCSRMVGPELFVQADLYTAGVSLALVLESPLAIVRSASADGSSLWFAMVKATCLVLVLRASSVETTAVCGSSRVPALGSLPAARKRYVRVCLRFQLPVVNSYIPTYLVHASLIHIASIERDAET